MNPKRENCKEWKRIGEQANNETSTKRENRENNVDLLYKPK